MAADTANTSEQDPAKAAEELRAARRRAAERLAQEQANADQGRESLFAQPNRYEF